MCMYCERRQDVQGGWDQPPLCDKNWIHPANSIPDRVSSNLNLDGEPDWEARIYDYQTTTPQLHLTSIDMGNLLMGKDGIACIYVPIKFCPVCGRKLGKVAGKTTMLEKLRRMSMKKAVTAITKFINAYTRELFDDKGNVIEKTISDWFDTEDQS